jgi:hypothetical protein
MTRSLMDSILRMVTPDMKHALASRLRESLEGVQSGLGAATAATLSGLDRKAADSEFLGQILGLLDGGAGPPIVASLPSVAASAPTGTAAETLSSFVRMLFGPQQAEVAGAISQHAGLSATSGPALLKVSAAVVLAYFVKGHSAGALTVDSLSSLLRAEAPTLHSYLPASLLPGAPAAVSSIPRRAVFAPPAVAARTSRWLVPLAVAGALLLGWLLFRALTGPGRHSGPRRKSTPRHRPQAIPLGQPGRRWATLNDTAAPATENSWLDLDRFEV